MQEILSSLMQEGESLSQEIIDIVLLNIVEPVKVHVHNNYGTTEVIQSGLLSLGVYKTSL